MNGELPMVALSRLVSAFPSKSRQASERKARRWAKRLSNALRAKCGKSWLVSENAVLPSGQTVKAFMLCGSGSDRLAGFVVPPGALDRWGEPDHERFLATHELLKRFDAFRAARAKMTEDGCAILFAETPDGAWARERGLSCDVRRIRSYRERLNPASPRFDGNMDQRGRRRATEEEKGQVFSPEAQRALRGLVLNQREVRVAEGYRLVVALASENGWTVPSLRSVQRWFEQLPETEKTYARKGLRRFQADCIPKIQREYGGLLAGEEWVGDERDFDHFCRVPDARKGFRPIRAKLTSILDVRSRMCVGWHIGERANSDTILSAMKMAAKAFGLPLKWTIDNGSDYRVVGGKRRRWNNLDESRLGTAAQQMAIEIVYTIAYWAWSKLIESWHRTIKDGYDRHQTTFCGGSSKERPANIKEFTGDVMTLPTLEEVRASFGTWLESYHASEHSGNAMNGLTPTLVMQRHRGAIRTCDPAVLDLLCCKTIGPKKVGRDGILHAGLRYGQLQEEIFMLQGREVWLRVDPERLDRVIVCDDKGVPICVATNERLKGGTQEDLRKAMEHKGRLTKKIREAQAGAVDLLFSKPEQVMELRRRAAKAAEDKIREQLPAVAKAPAVTIVRPDLHEAAQKLQKQSGFDRLAAKVAEEGAAARCRESMGAIYARLFGRAAKPEPAQEAQAFDWATYESRIKEAELGKEAALA